MSNRIQVGPLELTEVITPASQFITSISYVVSETTHVASSISSSMDIFGSATLILLRAPRGWKVVRLTAKSAACSILVRAFFKGRSLNRRRRWARPKHQKLQHITRSDMCKRK